MPTPASTRLLKQVARSVWGVVPDPPRRTKDLQPELIRGSAVAAAPDTLLEQLQLQPVLNPAVVWKTDGIYARRLPRQEHRHTAFYPMCPD